MNKKIIRTILFSALIGSMVFLGSSCSKKVVNPPESQADLSGGKNIQYPNAEGYSENNLGKEGTLTDTSKGGQTGNLSLNTPDMQSDSYKKEYGRSTSGFMPIYFDFDQSNIRPDMTQRMISNANYLKQNQNISIVIEGNCDPRGTNEYNLALGERRAITAKQYLVNLGIDAGRIRTVSYGEERPLFPGKDEESYAMDRRDDFRAE
jgi:peptidoglycan-associated lipoprotein